MAMAYDNTIMHVGNMLITSLLCMCNVAGNLVIFQLNFMYAYLIYLWLSCHSWKHGVFGSLYFFDTKTVT